MKSKKKREKSLLGRKGSEKSLEVILFAAFFLSAVGFFNIILPPSFQFMSTFDFFWFTGGIIGVAGACVVVTGLPCAMALAIFGLLSLFNYMIVSVNWVNLLIITPLSIGLIYILARLARGGG